MKKILVACLVVISLSNLSLGTRPAASCPLPSPMTMPNSLPCPKCRIGMALNTYNCGYNVYGVRCCTYKCNNCGAMFERCE